MALHPISLVSACTCRQGAPYPIVTLELTVIPSASPSLVKFVAGVLTNMEFGIVIAARHPELHLSRVANTVIVKPSRGKNMCCKQACDLFVLTVLQWSGRV